MTRARRVRATTTSTERNNAMRRIVLTLAVVGTFAAVANLNTATAKDSFDLKGQVYQNFKIEMKNSANSPLKTVKAGTHRIKIEDKTSIHSFHLTGPGVNKSTSVSGVGEAIWTVKLKPGKYTYFCDPHASSMRGSFRVTS
jgi:plastocyanin